MRPQLLERMPALDEKEYARNLGLDVSTMEPAPVANGGSNILDQPVSHGFAGIQITAADKLPLEEYNIAFITQYK